MSDRRIDITGLQVLASVLATITGAVAASYLGVAGTIIGAAVMSVASTAGSAVYKHYLGRTAGRLKELKEAAPVAAHKAAERMTGTGTRGSPHRAHVQTSEDDPLAGAGTSGRPPSYGHARASEDDLPTVVLPVTQLPIYRRRPGHDAAITSHTSSSGVTASPVDAGATSPAAHGDVNGGGRPGEDPPQRAGRWSPLSRWLRRRPGWLLGAVATVGLFAGVVGGITVFELAAGKPLDAVVWHRSGSGTTVGGIVGSQPSHSATTHTSKQSGKASSPSPSRTATNSPTPSPTPSSGSPSPTSSGSPSPTPSSSSPSQTPTASSSAHAHSS